MLLAGADIVPAKLLEIPRLGVLNPHYALLPHYRGMNVAEWSIFHDDPVGVSVHYVDAGIDTGDIAARRALLVDAGDTLESIRTKQQQLAVALLTEAVDGLAGGEGTRVGQRPHEGRQFYRMHPALRRRVEAKLHGDYAWLGRVPENVTLS